MEAEHLVPSTEIQNDLKDKIESLQNQVDFLQQKIIQLEQNQNILRETILNVFSEAPKSPKIDSLTLEQGHYTLESEKAPYLIENQSQIRNPTYQTKDIQSKSLLKQASKIDLKTPSRSQGYNLSSNTKQAQSDHNFITVRSNDLTLTISHSAWLRLSNLSENEKIEIIKLGFQLNQEGKISLKKYYESTDSNSLFQLKGYSIKYETIRRTKLYQQLKE